jgi:hypothetical protein
MNVQDHLHRVGAPGRRRPGSPGCANCSAGTSKPSRSKISPATSGRPTCSPATPDGRITLAGDRLIRTAAGRRTERRLGTDAEVLAAYCERFGISWRRVPL